MTEPLTTPLHSDPLMAERCDGYCAGDECVCPDPTKSAAYKRLERELAAARQSDDRLREAAKALIRRTDGLTVHFTGGMPYLVVKPDWPDALRAALASPVRPEGLDAAEQHPTVRQSGIDVETLAGATAAVVGWTGPITYHREWATKVAREYQRIIKYARLSDTTEDRIQDSKPGPAHKLLSQPTHPVRPEGLDVERLGRAMHDAIVLTGMGSCVHSPENEWAPWCDVLARRLRGEDMTRKDYILLATAFKGSRPDKYEDGPTDGFSREYSQWLYDRGCVADMLEIDNPRFDRGRFYAATEEPRHED
jgi:hypothetical protein